MDTWTFFLWSTCFQIHIGVCSNEPFLPRGRSCSIRRARLA